MTHAERIDLTNALTIIMEDKAAPSLKWAVNYTAHALGMVLLWQDTDADIKTQLLYVLNNITHWRHPDAKSVRGVLKAFVKAH